MKKIILVLSFIIFMYYLGVTIRYYRDMDKITIVEYGFYTKKNQKSNYINLSYKKIKDANLKEIIKNEKEDDDCSFDELGVPKCALKAKNNNIKYDKYYIIYYGNDTYKIIYKIKEIEYLNKIME